MQRINTTTKVLNMFGPGKHGFRNSDVANGILSTDLNAEFFNGQQESLSFVVEVVGDQLGGNTDLYNALKKLFGLAQVNAYVGGVKADFSTDDTVKLNAVLASAPNGASVVLPNADVRVEGGLSNDYGIKFTGPGRVLTPVPGGYRQENTYTNDVRLFFGQQHLWGLYEELRLQTPFIEFITAGDSTVQGALASVASGQGPGVQTVGWLSQPYFLQDLLPAMFAKKGCLLS